MLVLCNFLRKLMVSDKKIHRAFRTRTTLSINKTHSEKFFIFTIYQFNYTLALRRFWFFFSVRFHDAIVKRGLVRRSARPPHEADSLPHETEVRLMSGFLVTDVYRVTSVVSSVHDITI